jgi:hypothetical protein
LLLLSPPMIRQIRFGRVLSPSAVILLDAIDTYGAEAGVFVANVSLKLLLCDKECLVETINPTPDAVATAA